MKEEILNGINYRLNGWTKTAEVIKKSGGSEGDIIIPETVVFNERTYRVTSIGRHAFDGCDSLLSFTYQGTLAQWKKIKLGYFWKIPIPTAVLHCTDGDVKV